MKNNYILSILFFLVLSSLYSQTTDILTGLFNPRGLAVHGNDLYIAEISANKIVKISLLDADPTPVNVVVDLDSPKEIIFDGDILYISELNRISKVDVSTTLPAVRQDFYNGLTAPQGMLIHDNHLYSLGHNQSIFKFNLSSTPVTASLVINGLDVGFLNVLDFVKIDNEVYVADSGQILKFDVSLDSPIVETVLTSSDFPNIDSTNIGITAIGDTVYFLNNYYAKIFSFKINDPVSSLTEIATFSGTLTDVFADGNDLYISDYTNDKIFKYELSILSIPDIDLTIKPLSLFPNPVQNTIQISNLKGKQNYRICNLLGQEVSFGEIEMNNVIDVSDLLKGTYFLKLEGSQTPLRFIKK